MKWHNHLYIGKRLQEKKDKLIEEMEGGKYRGGVYLITLAYNGKDLMDIRSARSLYRSGLKESLPMIVGIASDREEAFTLCGTILSDCYKSRKDMNVREWIGRETV